MTRIPRQGTELGHASVLRTEVPLQAHPRKARAGSFLKLPKVHSPLPAVPCVDEAMVDIRLRVRQPGPGAMTAD